MKHDGECEKKRYMNTVGIVSYNIHCNFTNYGSALQSWALGWTIEGLKFGYGIPMEATAGGITN